MERMKNGDRLNRDLHGNTPDESSTAILVVDVINDLQFKEGRQLMPAAVEMAKTLGKLLQRARKNKIPIIYINDNFGKWRSDFNAQIRHCLEDGVPGRAVVRHLIPEPSDYYVLKPKHSGFYASPLDVLLRYIGVDSLILTGLTTDNCVFFTASDAYLRDYKLLVAEDCTAAITAEGKTEALKKMAKLLKAQICRGEEILFDKDQKYLIRNGPESELAKTGSINSAI